MTASRPISRFPIPDISSLPDDLRSMIENVQERMGFVPNVFLAMAHRPNQLRHFMAYSDELMNNDEGLTKAEREMIVVATSSANQCLYCVVSHGAILRIRSKQPTLADQLAINYREAPVTERQRVMLDYAVKLAKTPEVVTEADFQTLREAGFDDDAIWDIGGIVAFFAMSNRLATHTGMWPNPEFYGMAR